MELSSRVHSNTINWKAKANTLGLMDHGTKDKYTMDIDMVINRIILFLKDLVNSTLLMMMRFIKENGRMD